MPTPLPPKAAAKATLLVTLTTALTAALLAASPLPASAQAAAVAKRATAQLGPRPFFLVEDMTDSPLKQELQACAARRTGYVRSQFSIGHRGAPLQFPEHTQESYEAAALMGAGILECDVAFTKDKELVCRHAQNDLHTTTNILATPLAAKCTQPFVPATFDANGNRLTPATAECRTSDITLAEFKTLRGKMDAANANARTVAEYLGGTANWRTDLYSGPSSGTLLSHKESIALFQRLGVKMTPELKFPTVAMPFDGFTQEAYAQKLIDEYRAAGVPPQNVWPQSFHLPDVLHWVNSEPAFGVQAVFLDDANTMADVPSLADLQALRAQGVRIWAPPTFVLLAAGPGNSIVPSQAALNARTAGLDLITWTVERSGILADGSNGFYYQTFDSSVRREGDVLRVLDVLGRQIGVLGVFSDWPATTTFYANCAGLR